MKAIEYVTCNVCGYSYAGKIPPGGDGSVLMPRKHMKKVPGLSFYQRQKRGVGYCEGSFQIAKEYQEQVLLISNRELTQDEIDYAKTIVLPPDADKESE